jgi:two-component sensor histidine kinase
MTLQRKYVTARRALEREREDLLRKQESLLREKDVLLREMEHRVGNSLQIIAAIILMKSRMVKSEETRIHLQDAHKRVMSVAAVQQYLHVSGASGVEMGPYLSKLCESLKTSMIGDYRSTTLKVTSDGGSVTSREAVSLGLIVTELILNALKHAFPDDTKTDRQIAVGFDVAGTNWKVSVADNGIGAPVGVFAQAKSGLGTSIINALAQQLEARVEVLSGPQGTTVSVTHALQKCTVAFMTVLRRSPRSDPAQHTEADPLGRRPGGCGRPRSSAPPLFRESIHDGRSRRRPTSVTACWRTAAGASTQSRCCRSAAVNIGWASVYRGPGDGPAAPLSATQQPRPKTHRWLRYPGRRCSSH